MNKEKVKKMFAGIEKDLELKHKYIQLIQAHHIEMEQALDKKLVEFGKSAGFNFTAEELVEASAELFKHAKEKMELSNDDLNKVSGGDGGQSPYPTVQILQAAIAHRDSIRKSFESQRAALIEAIEAQRRTITDYVNSH